MMCVFSCSKNVCVVVCVCFLSLLSLFCDLPKIHTPAHTYILCTYTYVHIYTHNSVLYKYVPRTLSTESLLLLLGSNYEITPYLLHEKRRGREYLPTRPANVILPSRVLPMYTPSSRVFFLQKKTLWKRVCTHIYVCTSYLYTLLTKVL